jgi:hypothetical protein
MANLSAFFSSLIRGINSLQCLIHRRGERRESQESFERLPQKAANASEELAASI